MVRSTIIMGNGLGMALDPSYFSLTSGLENVWNSTEYLSEAHKNLILSSIEDTSHNEPPKSEEQLDKLHVAIVATEFLSTFKVNETCWVSDDAKELPSTYRKYIHEVANYFHESNKELPSNFIDPLSNFIKDTKTHLATLNYDNLLYDALQSTDVLKGYSGSLIDGFLDDGFLEDNLDRITPSDLGWYLHLHGSPLFDGKQKRMRDERDNLSLSEDGHVVLCHVKHKPFIIAASHILRTYWRYMEQALDESENIILLGYSGVDEHLNKFIKARRYEKNLTVIEWSGEGNHASRARFWKRATGFNTLELIQKDNILEFNEWDQFKE
jgi:hypothetical protein